MIYYTHYETVATICRKSGRECPTAVKAAERLRAGLSGTVYAQQYPHRAVLRC